MEIIKQEPIDEAEIHQGRIIQGMQYSLDTQHWYSNDDKGAKDIIDIPMTGKFKRYIYTDGSVSLPIVTIEVNDEQ